MKRVLIPCAVAILCGCSYISPPVDRSAQKRISEEMKQASVPMLEKATAPAAATSLPPSVSSSLLPPLRNGMPKTSSRQLEQRFDLVVTDAPINQVLMAIVSDTRYSILLSPKTVPAGFAAPVPGQVVTATARDAERLTVKLKDVTVFEALDAIRELYGYEYTVDGTRIYVQPPELKTSLYQVNYVLGQRRGVSDMQVIGGASSGSSGSSSGTSGTSGTTGTSGSGTTGGSFSSIQASALSSMSKSDVWGEMEDALRTGLGCQIAKSQPKSGGSAGSSGNATRADVSFVGDTQSGDRARGVEGCSDGRAMTVNQMSGTILVRGMPKELRLIENMLRSMQINIERQVIIEAKIIDVELNTGAQQGINWAAFNQGWHRASLGANTGVIDGTKGATAGSINAGTSLGNLLVSPAIEAVIPNAFSASMGIALQFTNFSALINFLETQGQVHVLSSPRIATLNNQKAVLKVGNEESFVTNASGGAIVPGTGGSPTTTTNPTITYQPFFSGISLDVTPQIDADDKITLHVHSMVNSISVKEKLAIIGTTGNGDRTLPFAVNSISETDSVVKTKDGQVIVIGGLMTQSGTDNRGSVPGIGEIPAVGALFTKGGQESKKRELVILLKPTVVKGENTWSNDIGATMGRMETLNASMPERPKY